MVATVDAVFELPEGKSVFFASDLHLGAPDAGASAERERAFVAWMDSIKPRAAALYLVGDVFDFWFEYRHAIPKGFARLQGRLADWADSGIPVFMFTGNHDLWMHNYFSQEFGIQVFHEPVRHVWSGKHFVVGHGDGLGPGDTGYKLLKRVFTFKPFQFLFRWLHPDLGIGLASWLSRGSRARTGHEDYAMTDVTRESIYLWALDQHRRSPADFWIFGHRHYPVNVDFPAGRGTYVNLGDWIKWRSWGEWDAEGFKLNP
ncbi:MAG: UDP-2,3-diacylglucosamine diphosphatase [Schleiferiaceae bacterium]